MLLWEKKMKIKIVLTTFAMLLCVSQVWAHSDQALDSQKSQNGGQVRMAGAYHLELVMGKDKKTGKENPVALYITDHGGTKIPSVGMSANITVLDGSNKSYIELKADGENRLQGNGSYTFNPKLKAVVLVNIKGQQEQARFTPFAAPSNSQSEHKH